MNINGIEHILSIEDLKIDFKSNGQMNEAVKGISFDLSSGQILGIVGESGSGKSVSCLSLLQLLNAPPAIISGAAIYRGAKKPLNLLSLKDHEIEKIRGAEISMIFQDPLSSLNPTVRCGKQVQEAILIHSDLSKEEAKAKVLSLFDKVKLGDCKRIYDSYPHQLSGGQIQRIMIAMAISSEPKILIADEPTTALDVTVQKEILKLIKEIQTELQTAIIFISHDLGVVHQIADEVIVMNQGEIVERGKTKEIFSFPQNSYTKGLIACRPPLNKRLNILPTIRDFDGKIPKSCGHENEISHSDFSKRINELEKREDIVKVSKLNTWYVKDTTFWGKPKTYTKAVKNVSFSIKKGETMGLVGESGSGKSTLGMSVLNLIPNNSGHVFFNGRSVFDLDKKEMKKMRKHFQIIFQNPYASLNPRMKIGEAILEPMQVHRLHHNASSRKEKVHELLNLVGLDSDHYRRYPHEFSGGQRQRISIARTLAVEPQFIVCDECVSALDVSVQAQILNLLKELQQEFNLSYLFISHDLSVVKHVSDHIMVMNRGEIVEFSDAESIYNNPQNEYTQRLIDSIPKII